MTTLTPPPPPPPPPPREVMQLYFTLQLPGAPTTVIPYKAICSAATKRIINSLN